MTSVAGTSLRQEVDAFQKRFQDLRTQGKVPPECEALVRGLLMLLQLLLAVLLEKATRKTSRNSGLPPSQTDPDESARRTGSHGKGPKPNPQTGGHRRTTTVKETITVDACDACGADLDDVDPVDRERRVLYDIVFEVVERRVDAEIKECPKCRARTKGRFPDLMPGPVQYGVSIQALVLNLLIAQMLSLRRAVSLVHAISGIRLSEATCLGYVRRFQDALASWEEVAVAHLLQRPALHVDETGFRVAGKTQWLHVVTDGTLTVKFPHRKRGREAIEEIGILPRYQGVLVHDCWAAYMGYEQCRHQLCGSHLLRERAFVVESNGYRWARLMKSLLREVCHRVNQSASKALNETDRRAVRKRYRTLLTQGAKELPDIPPRTKGTRGRIAKSDAHNLHERLVKHETSVLRFMKDPDVSFTNHAGEPKIRMTKVKIKVSGCFRTMLHATAWCRGSSFLTSMEALGYNPLVAIHIALNGKAADILNEHYGQPDPNKG